MTQYPDLSYPPLCNPVDPYAPSAPYSPVLYHVDADSRRFVSPLTWRPPLMAQALPTIHLSAITTIHIRPYSGGVPLTIDDEALALIKVADNDRNPLHLSYATPINNEYYEVIIDLIDHSDITYVGQGYMELTINDTVMLSDKCVIRAPLFPSNEQPPSPYGTIINVTDGSITLSTAPTLYQLSPIPSDQTELNLTFTPSNTDNIHKLLFHSEAPSLVINVDGASISGHYTGPGWYCAMVEESGSVIAINLERLTDFTTESVYTVKGFNTVLVEDEWPTYGRRDAFYIHATTREARIWTGGEWYPIGSTDMGTPAYGMSAYEEWLALGNTGSEQDFLTSLVGPPGIQGIPGVDGLSAYEVWVASGGVGDVATYLASLKGEPGLPGTNGTNGVDGITPHIDETTGNWFIGTTDTGVLAEGTNGVDGTNGTNGVDGVTPHIDETSGNWFIGETDTGIPAQGPAGLDGEDGAQGLPGEDGTDGVSPHIDETSGNWFIGETDTGILATGQDGEDGNDGTNGITPHIDETSGNWFIGEVDTGIHAQGLPGTNGVDGLSAYQIWLAQDNTGTEADFLASLQGPTLSNTAAVALDATAAVGSSGAAARADHVHPNTGLVKSSAIGAVNGVAGLGADGKVPAEQLPTTITAAEARRIAKKQALIFG